MSFALQLSREGACSMMNRELFLFTWCGMLLTLSGCGRDEKVIIPEKVERCAPEQPSASAGSQGNATVFMPDPISSSKDITLSPNSTSLDNFRVAVNLSHLEGKGVLKGPYVEVLNRLNCDDKFGAYDIHNSFNYSHSDGRFQEAMAYYFGDLYQSNLKEYGYLVTSQPVKIIAHCMLEDNAYFTRSFDLKGNRIEEVCLGDSVTSPGASYGDDASVTVHELQHSTTVNNYSVTQYLNQFWYDEAGALNEAISDFMSLIFTDAMVPSESGLDFRIFSRWALGTFDSSTSHLRGANRCPMYDSSYPNCDHFPSFQVKGGANKRTDISYVYPDGMGWPYADRYGNRHSAKKTYMQYPSQEEIHNADMLMLGSLWDVYEGVKNNHAESPAEVTRILSQLVLESVRNLPPSNQETNHSPVSFIGFASNMVATMDHIQGIQSADKIAIRNALKERGLYNVSQLTEGWMEVGSGTNFRIPYTETPGIHVMDDPILIKKWFSQMLDKPDARDLEILDYQTANDKLDPGDIAAIWFDIQNDQSLTAGGVLLTVTSTDSDISIMSEGTNIGYLTLSAENQTQIMYGKVNGTSIVEQLNTPSAATSVPMGNSYFKTNPFFNRTWRTAIWVRVSPLAAHGKVVDLEVRAEPSNGVAEIKSFPVEIH